MITSPTLTSARSLVLCDSTALNYPASSNPSGAEITWQRAEVAGISNTSANGSNPIIETLDNTTSQPVLVKYILTITNGSCVATDSVLVTVNPTPVINHVSDTSFCNGTPVSGIIFSSASPNTLFEWHGTQTIGFASAGSGNISSFFATNTSNLPIADTVTVLIDSSNNHCSGDSIRFVIIVNPSPQKPEFSWLNGFDSLCMGSKNINFNVISPANTASYLWSTIPPFNQAISIKDADDPNTIISFLNSGIDTIQVLATNLEYQKCADSVAHIVKVNPTEGIDERKIFKKQPGNLLIYPDNSMNLINGYQWGYDSLLRTQPDPAYGPATALQGQVYQFLIPEERFVINGELDTINYAFWVLLRKGECFSRVYYNGPYATGRMQYVPQDDNTVTLHLFPNPNNGIFEIVLKGDIYGNIDAKIYNAMGQLVFSNNFNKTTGEIKIKFNAADLSGGLYYLVIRSSDLKKVVTRFIIQQ